MERCSTTRGTPEPASDSRASWAYPTRTRRTIAAPGRSRSAPTGRSEGRSLSPRSGPIRHSGGSTSYASPGSRSFPSPNRCGGGYSRSRRDRRPLAPCDRSGKDRRVAREPPGRRGAHPRLGVNADRPLRGGAGGELAPGARPAEREVDAAVDREAHVPPVVPGVPARGESRVIHEDAPRRGPHVGGDLVLEPPSFRGSLEEADPTVPVGPSEGPPAVGALEQSPFGDVADERRARPPEVVEPNEELAVGRPEERPRRVRVSGDRSTAACAIISAERTVLW